jgi:hypothetical protein
MWLLLHRFRRYLLCRCKGLHEVAGLSCLPSLCDPNDHFSRLLAFLGSGYWFMDSFHKLLVPDGVPCERNHGT